MASPCTCMSGCLLDGSSILEMCCALRDSTSSYVKSCWTEVDRPSVVGAVVRLVAVVLED